MTDASSQRLEQLEQQVKDLTERRLQHLEVLQQQQMEMQVRKQCAVKATVTLVWVKLFLFKMCCVYSFIYVLKDSVLMHHYQQGIMDSVTDITVVSLADFVLPSFFFCFRSHS